MSSAAFTVVGAGPVGALMAWLLAQRGLNVEVFERRSDPRKSALHGGRSINLALAARGLRALEEAGLLAALGGQLVSMRGRMLHSVQGEQQFLPYSQRVGEVIHSIGREQLNRLLIEAVAAHPRIALHFDRRCTDVDASGGTLELEEPSGRRFPHPFQILLAADGAGSAVRQALVHRGLSSAREEDLAHDYKELVIEPPSAAAAQAAFEPHALHIWPRGGFMLIALPNSDRSFTATLFLARRGDPSFEYLREHGAVRAFFEREFADAATHVVDLEQQFQTHPQGQLGTLYCERWQFAGRVLLLGDAAHAIVPFHGQGLNCGLEDCRVLDRLLTETSMSAALTQFEQRRRPDAAAIAAMALENYLEMRDGVRSPQFAQRQHLAAELEQLFPGRFIPRYSMVMFHDEIPYAEAQRRGLLQQRVLDALIARRGYGPLDDSGQSAARQLLDEQGL